MPRGLSVVASAALLCGLAYYFLQGMIGSGRALEEIVLATCAAALTLATVSAAFSVLAMVRANASGLQLRRLALSVEAALRDFSARSDGDAVTIGELDASLSRRLDELAASLAARQQRSSTAKSATIVQHPAIRLLPADMSAAAQLAAGSASLRAAIQRALAANRLELDPQPIVSISQGAAIAYETSGLVQPTGGAPLRLGRAALDLAGAQQAAIERLLVTTALNAIERREDEATPFHVPVSAALLDNGSEFAAALTELGQRPVLARNIVLSVLGPAISDGHHAQALALLVDSGAGLAAEGWSGSFDEIETMRRAGVSMLKLPAAQLLDSSPAAQSVERLLKNASAAGIAVAATDVASDAEAVRLIDIGVNLMTGPRFAEHKPLQTAPADRLAL